MKHELNSGQQIKNFTKKNEAKHASLKIKTMRTIYDYAKLSLEEKNILLSDEALLLDKYRDKENTVYVYHLDDFFIELTMRDGIVTDNIPYKRGYRFDKKNTHELEKRNAFLHLAA